MGRLYEKNKSHKIQLNESKSAYKNVTKEKNYLAGCQMGWELGGVIWKSTRNIEDTILELSSNIDLAS